MAVWQNIRKLWSAVRRFGVGGVLPYLVSYARKRRDRRDYRKWIGQSAIDVQRRSEMRREIDELGAHPLISIILPVYNVDEKWLRKCIDSVLEQIYPNWELCIADDASTRGHIRPLIENYAANDKRIKAAFREQNGHISAASNTALELAMGEFAVLLDHDDELAEDALFWVAKELNDHPDAAMIYSDEDLIDEYGIRREPKFKPDFSRDLMYSLNLVTHLSAYRTQLLRRIGGFRIGLEGSQDYDLALRVIEQIPGSAIRHIPRVLYHWRTIDTSVAGNAGAKPYAFTKAREAIGSHFERTGKDATVEAAVDDLNRVRYRSSDPEPMVSLIVAGEPAAELESRTDHERLELISVPDERDLAKQLNLGASSAKGDVLCFLDGSLAPVSPDWLREMVSFATEPEIGAVGAKLMQINGSIDQTGIILGGSELIRKAHNGLPHDHGGNFFRAGLIGNYSAVSWRCMVIRRSIFDEIGKFDAAHYSENLFDVDLCLQLRRRSLRIVYTPYAELITISQTKRKPAKRAEIDFFQSRWKNDLDRDPYYNPNFASAGEPFRYRV